MDASPFVFLKKIPITEYWRFFVDLRRQEDDCFYDYLIELSSRAKQSQFELGRFCSTQSSLMKLFKKGDELLPLYQFLIIQPNIGKAMKNFYGAAIERNKNISTLKFLKAQKGWNAFEQKEPNYLTGMMKGFAKVLEAIQSKKKISVPYLKRLHHLILDNVEFTNYDLEKNALKNELRLSLDSKLIQNTIGYACFPLLASNSSVKGIERIIQHRDNKDNYFRIFEVSNTKLYEVDFNDAQAPDAEYILKDPSGKHFYLANIIGSWHEDNVSSVAILTRELEKFIEVYYQEIETASSEESKILAIVSFIQKCEQLHPFNDANCRLFCMLILNQLLMQNGFTPCIMGDPNCFDAFSPDELVTEVKIGMTRSILLSQQQPIACYSTAELLNELDEKEQRYFYQALMPLKNLPFLQNEKESALANMGMFANEKTPLLNKFIKSYSTWHPK